MNKEIERMIKEYGTQQIVADLLGVTEGAVSHWLTGKRTMSNELALLAQKRTAGRYRAAKLVFGDDA